MALPAAVKSLGLVSLLTDASSDMIYPLLPAFLTGTLGARASFVGLVEGLAEAMASLLKIVSGRLADRMPRKKPLIVAGYALSSLSRPVVALATAPWHVLAVRVMDRIGKGVRGAPRDALLAHVTPPADRGRAYGFHRAMDNAGAVLGPLLASGVLLLHGDVRTVFALAAVPALLSLAVLVFGVREEAPAAPASPSASEDPAAPLGAAPLTPGCVPFLRVVDARRSLGLYCDGLGFRKNWEHQLASGFPLVVSLSRGAATVFLTEHPECAAGSLVYFYVEDVDDLARELGTAGITVEWGPIDQPWGLREIQVQDFDGNRLRFGAEIELSA